MITSWFAKQPKNIHIQQVQHVRPVTMCWPNRWYHAMEIEAHEGPCPWGTGWCREFHRLFFETTLARRVMEETSRILVDFMILLVYMSKAKKLLFKWNVSIFVTQQDPGATSSYLDHYTLPITYRYQKNIFPHILVNWCHLTFWGTWQPLHVRNSKHRFLPSALASCPGSVFDTAVTDSGSGWPMASAPMTWRFKPAVMARGNICPLVNLT